MPRTRNVSLWFLSDLNFDDFSVIFSFARLAEAGQNLQGLVPNAADGISQFTPFFKSYVLLDAYGFQERL
jgi:hypothetical protein